MKVALFGGTFDPIHQAHVTIAREALQAFALDQVLFIPANEPPHKPASRHAPYEDRYRMVELACAGQPGLVASRLEEAPGRSYSILTIERVKRERPGDQFSFLIGADAFADIESWRRWQDVVREVDFIVASRPGHQYRIPTDARVHRLETVALPVSSSEIRNQLAAGAKPPELPDKIYEYIRARSLYR